MERLADARVGLEAKDVEPLLNDPDVDVALYALALVQDSPDRDHLIEVAHKIADAGHQAPFANELETLITLLARDAEAKH
jgi:hypothetical protein